MSMNMFFRAFTQEEIEAMTKDHALIDQLVEDEKYVIDTDVETAWDVLREILSGAGILAGEAVDDALFNGCMLISAKEVQREAQALASWSHEQVLARLADVSEEAYHGDIFRGEPGDLLEQFDALVRFYQEASEKGLAALSYLA